MCTHEHYPHILLWGKFKYFGAMQMNLTKALTWLFLSSAVFSKEILIKKVIDVRAVCH